MQVQVLNGVTAANGAPTLASHGFPLFKSSRDMQFIDPQRDGLYDNVDEVTVALKAAGAGALSIDYLRLWGYHQVTDAGVDASFWAPLGTGADADKGKLNGTTVAIGGTSTIVHSERVRGLRDVMRVYLEVGTYTGAFTSSDAWLISRGQAQ
jgi:hypothetical protein